jgi:hypothetical protein
MDAKERAKPCKRGHQDRYPDGRCRACANLRAAQWAKDNPARAAENWAKSHARPEARAAQRAHYSANKAIYIERATERNRNNPVARLRYNRVWSEKNRDKRALYNVARRTAVAIATPAWASEEEIAVIYAEAQRLTNETGVRQSVDHFYPLKGKNVCGLHVPANLRVIPYVENCRKGNRCDG